MGNLIDAGNMAILDTDTFYSAYIDRIDSLRPDDRSDLLAFNIKPEIKNMADIEDVITDFFDLYDPDHLACYLDIEVDRNTLTVTNTNWGNSQLIIKQAGTRLTLEVTGNYIDVENGLPRYVSWHKPTTTRKDIASYLKAVFFI